MVIDDLSHALRYATISAWMDLALRFLQESDLEALPLGRIALYGNQVYAVVQEFTTRPLNGEPWEAHRRYIDVHYLLRGEEKIGYTPVGRLQPGEYDPERDYLPLQGPGDFFQLNPGYFTIMMPGDAHLPGLSVGEPLTVKKVVLKVAV